MRTSPSERIGQIALNVLMTAFLCLTLYPLVHVLFASVSDPARLSIHRGPILVPLGLSSQPFKLLFTNQFILSGLVSSAIIVVCGVTVNIFMTAIAAYVLSKRRARLTKIFTVFVVFTMLFSGGLVPLYLTVKGLGLYNNYFAVILPFAINTINLLILRSAFDSIPESLEEAARIDGAGHLTILFRVSIPVILPMIAVMILYYAVDRWNGWFYASVFFKDRKLFPLQLVLRDLLIDADAGSMVSDNANTERMMLAESIRYAAIVIGTLPVLFFYPFLQRYFVKGSLAGAIKE